MKTPLTHGFALLLLALCLPARAQTTSFTYQGRLDYGGVPITGTNDFQFSVWDALSGGNQVGLVNTLTRPVTNGLFTATLDFGNTPFAAGAPRWLEIAVRTNNPGNPPPYAILSPRQALSSVPYALTAGNLTGA